MTYIVADHMSIVAEDEQGVLHTYTGGDPISLDPDDDTTRTRLAFGMIASEETA